MSPGQKKRILVVEAKIGFREPIIAKLTSVGYIATAAEDGKNAIRSLELQLPDMIILGQHLERLDGLGVLARIRGEPNWRHIPIIFIADDFSPETERHAQHFGVEHYLIKSKFSIHDLLRAIDDAFAIAAELHEKYSRMLEPLILTSPVDLSGLVQNIRQTDTALDEYYAHRVNRALSSLSADILTEIDLGKRIDTGRAIARTVQALGDASRSSTAKSLFALSQGSAATNAEVAEFLARHPTIVERVLAVLSSPAFCRDKVPVTTLGEAVAKFDLPVIKGVLALVGVSDLLTTVLGAIPEVTDFLEHALAVSLLMIQLSYRPDPNSLPTFYLIGIFHDFAEVLIRREFPQDFARAEETALSTGRGIYHVREEIFGINNTELAALSLAEFDLPELVQNSITSFFDQFLPEPPGASPLVQLLMIADSLANGCGLSNSRASLVRPITKNEYRRVVGISSPVDFHSDQFTEAVRSTVRTLRESGGIPIGPETPRDEAKKVKVWYARHNSFSLPDPLAEALRTCAVVDLHYRLPAHAQQAHTAKGIVVATPDRETELLSLAHLERMLKSEQKPGTKTLYLVDKLDEKLLEEVKGHPNIRVSTYPISVQALVDFIRSL